MLLYTLVCLYLFKLVFPISSDIYPRVELLEPMAVLFLVFWGTFMLFSTMAVPTYIPTNSVEVVSFLDILSNIFYFLFTFLWWIAILSIFPCACWLSLWLLWKAFIFVFSFFKKNYHLLFWCKCLYILDITSLSVTSFANIFSQSVGCLSFCCVKPFKFNYVSFVYFCFSLL